MKNKIFIFIFLLFLLINFIEAKTYLNGYYQFYTSTYRNSNHKWDMNSPDNYFQLKFYSNPSDKAEVFAQLGSGGMNNKEGARLENGHLKFFYGKEKTGFEAYLFTMQDRLWMGHHTLNFVNGSSDYEGIRSKIWLNALNGWFDFEFVLANNKNDNADIQIFQLHRNFLKDDRLKLSFNGAKKIWGDEDDKYNSYYSQYIQYKLLKDCFLTFEISKSYDPSQTPSGNDLATKFEARWLKYENENFGELGYGFTYENYGKNYRCYLGSNNSNYINYYNEMYYNFPMKSITFVLKNNYKEDVGHNFIERWFYFENYIEFIEGYKFKFAYETSENKWGDNYPKLLFQIEKNIKEVQYKVQYRRLKNWVTKTNNDLFGLENKFKLYKEVLTLYWRLVFLKDKTLNFRKENIFANLRYDLGWDAECYLEYGESWYNDGDLTNDGDFIGSNSYDYEHRKTTDVIKFKLSINF